MFARVARVAVGVKNRVKINPPYTGCNKKNGHPTTEGNVSFPKRLNLTSKFDMFGFLGIVNLQKKIYDSFSKIVDVFLMPNSFPLF